MSNANRLLEALLVPDLLEPKAAPRRRHTDFFAITALDQPARVLGRPAAVPHLQQGSGDAPDHLFQKSRTNELNFNQPDSSPAAVVRTDAFDPWKRGRL